ncbi:MAG: hypothetical protein PHQ96_05890 [Candidatus Omnitrophica bacterium]|nr:hypothetical protein [Candidatus Omnitrophota bacterium]
MRKTIKYKEPLAKVLKVIVNAEITKILLQLDAAPPSPLFPSGLYLKNKPEKLASELHYLKDNLNPYFLFETYEKENTLKEGKKYIFRCWWTPDQFEIATNKNIQWEKQRFLNDKDHEHCLLTWEEISTNSKNKEAYKSEYGWITIEAYEKFIAQNKFRLRK